MVLSPFDASVDEMLFQNRCNQVRFNWLSFMQVEGAQAAKEAMRSQLTSIGVIAALMSAFFLAEVQNPPTVEDQEFDNKGWELQVQAGCASAAFLLSLATVILVIILHSYASLFAEAEFHVYLYYFSIASASFPSFLAFLGGLSGLVSVALRLKIVFGHVVWIVYCGVAGAIFVGLIVMFVWLDITTTMLRKHVHARGSTTPGGIGGKGADIPMKELDEFDE
ncbi:hypothetical protein QOT17_012891 [Balamuthia mandrillaris]